jgi:hypothetical protein
VPALMPGPSAPRFKTCSCSLRYHPRCTAAQARCRTAMTSARARAAKPPTSLAMPPRTPLPRASTFTPRNPCCRRVRTRQEGQPEGKIHRVGPKFAS